MHKSHKILIGIMVIFTIMPKSAKAMSKFRYRTQLHTIIKNHQNLNFWINRKAPIGSKLEMAFDATVGTAGGFVGMGIGTLGGMIGGTAIGVGLPIPYRAANIDRDTMRDGIATGSITGGIAGGAGASIACGGPIGLAAYSSTMASFYAYGKYKKIRKPLQ